MWYLGSGESKVEWNTRSATDKTSGRVTIWAALSALALGVLLGVIGALCSQWVDDSPLVCTALRSAFSAMVLAVLAPARPQDLVLEMQSLRTCPEVGRSNTQGTRDLCGQRTKARPGFAVS
jgi:hypothetical protein